MGSRTVRIAAGIVAVLVVASVLGGCRTVKPGTRCRTTDYAQSGNYVMVCRKGRWTRFLTKAQATSAVVALLRAKDAATTTTAAPVTPQPEIIVPPSTTVPPTTVPAPVVPKATTVSVGLRHACAVIDDGSVRCWGDNHVGQLGNGEGPYPAIAAGPPTFRDTPRTVSNLTDAVDVEVGEDFACALRVGGTVSCWGDNHLGQLGSDTRAPGAPFRSPTQSVVPMVIAGLTGVAEVRVGTDTACAVRTNAEVWCWGAAGGGTGASTDAFAPVQIPAGVSVPAMEPEPATFEEAMAATGCGLTAGRVQCWNVLDPNQNPWHLGTTPVDMGLAGVVELSGWREQACARTTAGQLWCFGHNDVGQLGNGTALQSGGSQTPVRVPGIG